MKKLITLLFIAFTFWSCEKETSGFKKVYATFEAKSTGAIGDIATLECTSQSPQVGIVVGDFGDFGGPVIEKSQEVSMPIGSNMTYLIYVMEGGNFDEPLKAWSDMTFKVYVGNKVKYTKKFTKGDINCAASGNIIIE